MIAFCADTHISPRLWQTLPQVTGDSYSSWAQIVEGCVAHKVKCLIIGGDVFDAAPTPEDVHQFLNGVCRLRDVGIPVLAIQGQHGRNRDFPWTGVNDYVIDLDRLKEPVRVDDFSIVGVDNCAPSELAGRLKALPKTANTLVVHQLLEGFAGSFFDMKPEWVPDHIKLVLMGDLHQPVETQRNTSNGIQRFVYNGSTVIRSITEPAVKSYMLLDGDKITRVPLMTRPVLPFNVFDGSPEALAKLAEGLRAVPDQGVAYIRVDPRIPDVDAFCRGANTKIHYIIKPVAITETSAGPETTTAPEVSLAGCLSTLVDREKEPLFYDFVMQLLRTTSPADVIKLYSAKVQEAFVDAEH